MWGRRLVLLVLAASAVGRVDAVNWAQGSGRRTQPVVVPHFGGWSARWGHALVAQEQAGMLFLMGGDDGDGGVHNDVWRTSGSSWSVIEKVTTGESKVYSQLSWKRMWPDKVPPAGTGYYEWIECFDRKWQGSPTCTSQDDPFRGDLRRWSPRRNHASVEFGPAGTIWVIGGRASDNTGTDHEARLKNDVWSSTDGVSWTLVNPGCRFEDVQAYPSLGAEHALCRSDVDCYGNSHCVNVLTNQPVSSSASSPTNRCRCQMFQPRERHAVAVFGDRMYVSGGIVEVRATDCGDFPCNRGYTQVAADVWSSEDGEVWTREPGASHAYADHGLIASDGTLWVVSRNQTPVDALGAVPSAQSGDNNGAFVKGLPWPRSAEQHAVSLESDEAFLYVESATVMEKYVAALGAWRPITDDVNNVEDLRYVWADAPVDRVGAGISAAEVAAIQRHGGATTLRALAGLSAQTVVDLRAKHNVTFICRYTKRALAVLNKCKLDADVPDGFANFSTQVTVTDPMTHPFWATSLRGAIVPGEESAASRVTLTAAAAAADDGLLDSHSDDNAAASEAEGHFIYGWDGCQQAELAEEQFAHLTDEVPQLQWNAERGSVPDLTCRWGFAETTRVTAINFEDKLFVAQAGNTWYRDDTVPVTLMPVKPEESTSDTLFEFQCDEPGCLFEYTLHAMEPLVELQRWTRTTGKALDVAALLPGGGTYRVVARAVDAAGNVDVAVQEGRNQHTWTYSPAIPVGLVMGILFSLVIVMLAVYLEMRRRKKKAALERYALKRMRRKFKGMQKKNKKSKDAKGGKAKKKKGKGKAKAKGKAKDTDTKKKKTKKNDDKSKRLSGKDDDPKAKAKARKKAKRAKKKKAKS